MNFIKKNGKGVLLCLMIAIPSWILGKIFPIVGGPVFAILLGMVITLLVSDKSALQSGITFVSKKILQYAVILLGFGMNLSVILQTGKQSLPIILATITTSLVVAWVLHKILHVPGKISTLIGVGSVEAPQLQLLLLSLTLMMRKLHNQFLSFSFSICLPLYFFLCLAPFLVFPRQAEKLSVFLPELL